MTSLKIKVTEEILRQSANCDNSNKGANCAIALSVRTIFPNASVGTRTIYPFYNTDNCTIHFIELPEEAQDFIKSFDNKCSLDRVKMEELEFSIDIPDSVLETINIEEIKPLLINHPTLELIEN